LANSGVNRWVQRETVTWSDLDAALGEQLLDVAIGQAEARVPADCKHDHVGWEAKPANADRAMDGGRRRVLI
jgi:hypothetical protein